MAAKGNTLGRDARAHTIDDGPITETQSQALAKVSTVTRETIEAALKKIDPNASLDDYEGGKTWTSGSGLVLHLIARAQRHAA